MADAQRSSDAANETELSGLQKVAILLLALKQQTATKILKHLQRNQVEDISCEIASIDRVSPQVRTGVITQFYNLLLARQYMDTGGLPLARSLLEKTLPADEARRIVEALEHHVHEQPFSFLQKTETENLLTFLQGERTSKPAVVSPHAGSPVSDKSPPHCP